MLASMSPDGTVRTLARIAAEAENLLVRRDLGNLAYGNGGAELAGEAHYHAIRNIERSERGELTFHDLLLEEVYAALATEGSDMLREYLVGSAAVLIAWITVIDVRSGQ